MTDPYRQNQISHSYEYKNVSAKPINGRSVFVTEITRLCDGEPGTIEGVQAVKQGPPHKIDCPKCLAILDARDNAADIQRAFGDSDVVRPVASTASTSPMFIDGEDEDA